MNKLATVTGAVAALVGLTLGLTACSTDPLAEQYRAGSNKNYIAGDGSVTEIAVANRSEPIVFEGTTQDGQVVNSEQYLGSPLVVNFWYAGCAPCRAEAKDLEQVYQETKSAPTLSNFLGVNVRDTAETVKTFNSTFGMTYPSVIDQNGALQLAFASNVQPNAVPTTLVLDKQGRVAARILGQLKDSSILKTLVTDIGAEK